MAVESGTTTSASKLMADGPEMCLVYCRCWNFTEVISCVRLSDSITNHYVNPMSTEEIHDDVLKPPNLVSQSFPRIFGLSPWHQARLSNLSRIKASRPCIHGATLSFILLLSYASRISHSHSHPGSQSTRQFTRTHWQLTLRTSPCSRRYPNPKSQHRKLPIES